MSWSLLPNTTQPYLPYTNAGYGKRNLEFMQNVSLNLPLKALNTAGMKFVMIANGNKIIQGIPIERILYAERKLATGREIAPICLSGL